MSYANAVREFSALCPLFPFAKGNCSLTQFKSGPNCWPKKGRLVDTKKLFREHLRFAEMEGKVYWQNTLALSSVFRGNVCSGKVKQKLRDFYC